MITLRTVEIETDEDADSLLTNLKGNTERFHSRFYKFSFFKTNVGGQWFGQIDFEQRQFELLRNKGQTEFGPYYSGIVCKGEITKKLNGSLIKINLQPTGYIFFNNLVLMISLIIGVTLIPIDVLFELWWVVLIWTVGLILNFVQLTRELNKTESRLIEYFDR